MAKKVLTISEPFHTLTVGSTERIPVLEWKEKGTMAKEDQRAAPYISFKTFQTALDVLLQGLPDQLDTSVWPTLAGGVKTQVLLAFKFLGLVDDEGRVQESLERLLDPEQDRKVVLREILERSYPEVVELGRTNASPAQLSEAMRNYGVSGATLQKAERFFLQAAGFTQLRVSPLWKKVRQVPTSGRRKAGSTKRRKRVPKEDSEPEPGGRAPGKAQNLIAVNLQSGGMIVLGVTVDVTKMSTEDRFFVFDLIDKMRAYQDGQQKPAEEDTEPPSDLPEQEGGTESGSK
jgi:hypothetical protein